jgi:hypothetical protein
MAILVDLNQVLISNLMQQINNNPKIKLEESLIRHMVLNSLRSYITQFKSKYGDMIICCDSKTYWRRDFFPFYKANRKKDREKSGFDWNLIFLTLNKIRDELKENFPYKVLEVDKAEADDIIGVLAARLSAHEDILILSSDKDFAQLQKYPNVTQYSPILKRFIKTEDPQGYIKEHIIRGDRGDGVPNFLSPDNIFAVGGRQKVINTKKLQEWLRSDPSVFCENDNMKRGYSRNMTLVDLSYTPEDIKAKIVEAYENTKGHSRQKMFNYFIEHRLSNLMEVIHEF